MTGIIRERYEVEAVIRKGRQGEVLRAQDLNHSNLVLTPRGDLVLVDLGSSANGAVGDGQRTTATARYAAPELAVAPPTPAADIYSLAATGYALLTGEPPRAGIRPALPG